MSKQDRINEQIYNVLKHHEAMGKQYFACIKSMHKQIGNLQTQIKVLETTVNYLEREINGTNTE